MPRASREAEMGRNRTGVGTAPENIKKMLSGMDELMEGNAPAGDETAMAGVRVAYIEHADPVGSVPPPATVKGAAKSGAKMMTGKRPQLFLDQLGARLAFERSGARLYEALITKCEAAADGVIDLARLRHFCDEEVHHFALIKECMEKLGADPTAQTPCADVEGMESAGLMQVITDPKTTVAQSLHAILIAELADNAAWDGLITLAQKMGHDDMVEQFTEAQQAEREHLETVRAWHEELVLTEADLVKA
ncbi:MAG TPA: ferritin-like domain-containing protein [Burkholderiales bacterium]|nr:ferritin-like domain-containing protein [Burkholderiales bacterium]